MNFSGKVAVITGGASGIGFAIAQAIAQQGANVVLADIQKESLATAVDSIKKLGVEVLGIQLDVTDRSAVYNAADQVEQHFGRVDLVFNNAGVGDAGTPLDQVSDKLFDWVFNVNLFGVMNVLKAFVPKIKKSGQGGHIVNTSSMAGLVLIPGWNVGLYSATKMAVLALSLDLRDVLEKENIGVSTLCPGFIQTNIEKNATALRPLELTDAIPNFPKELASGGMPAAELAEIVIKGIEKNTPIIVTHPEFLPAVTEYHEKIQRAFRSESTS